MQEIELGIADISTQWAQEGSDYKRNNKIYEDIKKEPAEEDNQQYNNAQVKNRLLYFQRIRHNMKKACACVKLEKKSS